MNNGIVRVIIGKIKYFRLYDNRRGGGDDTLLGGGKDSNKPASIISEFVVYIAALLGVVADKALNDALGTSSWESYVGAVAISIVIFPTIYRKAMKETSRVSMLQFAISFQHGFFWSEVVSKINV